MTELITMTQKELLRYGVIKDLMDNKFNGTVAAKQLNLSNRHIRRLKRKVEEKGIKGLIHNNRGKLSNRKLDKTKIEKIENAVKENYRDFGPTLASEKLKEIQKININKETLRLLMIGWGLWKTRARNKNKEYRAWRPRKEYFGEMQQFDGSYHKWFENRGEECCLLVSIDDATGKITHAKFGKNESVKSVFDFWLGYFEKNNLPLSIYLDKFSTYKINHKNAVDNSEMITQFQRAMDQMAIKLITAHSPEAKGRIERLFETLQDRLVKELRLANISTIQEANEFLEIYIPKFNAKFAVVPQKNKNLHRKMDEQLKEKLPQIFSIQNSRIICNDYTVRFKNQYFQLRIEQPTTVYKKDTVIMEERLNDEIKICHKGHYLNYFELPERPKKQIDVNLVAITARKPLNWKPPIDHPWRKFIINPKEVSSIIMD